MALQKSSRRSFLSRLGWVSLGISIGAVGYGSVSYLASHQRPREDKSLIAVGQISDFSVGDQKLIEPYHYVLRSAQGFQAISALCTYEGCGLRPFAPARGQLSEPYANCPCCGSAFALSGEVLAGPAQRPLPFFALRLRAQELLIDLTETDEADPYVLRSGRGVSNLLFLDPVT